MEADRLSRLCLEAEESRFHFRAVQVEDMAAVIALREHQVSEEEAIPVEAPTLRIIQGRTPERDPILVPEGIH